MILPLLLSFCNKAVLPLVNQLGTKPLSRHSLSCDLTLQCKLLKFFNQNPWTESGPGDFQFGIAFGYIYLLLFCNSDFTLQVFQQFRIPVIIYQLTPYVTPKLFLIIQHLADHHHIFLRLLQFLIKLPLIILKHIFKPIFPFLIPPNFCCNSYNPLLWFFNNNTQCFYSNAVFSFYCLPMPYNTNFLLLWWI